jgi:hypothetical protein
MAEEENLESQAPTNIVREVFVNLQNSSGVDLIVTTFAVSNGYWDPAAPNGIPTQGYTINPGQNPTWGNYTSIPFTGVSGTMTINSAGTGTVVLAWSWPYGSTASATATITVPGIKAATTLTGQGSSNITMTVQISGT